MPWGDADLQLSGCRCIPIQLLDSVQRSCSDGTAQTTSLSAFSEAFSSVKLREYSSPCSFALQPAKHRGSRSSGLAQVGQSFLRASFQPRELFLADILAKVCEVVLDTKAVSGNLTRAINQHAPEDG